MNNEKWLFIFTTYPKRKLDSAIALKPDSFFFLSRAVVNLIQKAVTARSCFHLSGDEAIELMTQIYCALMVYRSTASTDRLDSITKKYGIVVTDNLDFKDDDLPDEP